MTQQSVFHLEPFARFLRRVVELNRLHSPDDRLHDALSLDHDRWHAFVQEAGPDADAAIAARKELALIHEHFPTGAPAHRQAAYLVRAFSVARPFAEANHRTGWDYVSELLEHNGFTLMAGADDGRSLGNEVWERIDGTAADVEDDDEVLDYLSDWFKPRIAKTG